MNIRELTKEQLAEESLIDLAYGLLEESKTPFLFFDLLKEIQNLNGLSDEEIKDRLVQFYTDMNIDGRFLLNHDNTWGLREWYKIETIEEETAPTVKARKRKSKSAIADDEEDLLVDEDDLVFEEDLEEFVEEDLDEEDDDLDFDEDDDDIDSIDVDAEIDEDLEDVDVDVDVDVDDDLIDEEDAFIIEDDVDDDLDEDLEDEDK